MLNREPRVVQKCGLDDRDYQPWLAINGCPYEQVIRIRSAEVGFSDRCSQNVDCTRPTNHSEIINCNGQRSCSITDRVLRYNASDRLCDKHQNGNFITITYVCINGT